MLALKNIGCLKTYLRVVGVNLGTTSSCNTTLVTIDFISSAVPSSTQQGDAYEKQ
jgi:hypothetical protein